MVGGERKDLWPAVAYATNSVGHSRLHKCDDSVDIKWQLARLHGLNSCPSTCLTNLHQPDAKQASVFVSLLLSRQLCVMLYRIEPFCLMVQVPEHTWGFDTKTFLHDNSNWSNKDFHTQLDTHAQNYEDNIAQWQRQRSYMTWALEALDLSLTQASSPLDPIHAGHNLSQDSVRAADSAADGSHNSAERQLSAHGVADSAQSAHGTHRGLRLPELSLAQELEQVRSELQRQHELTDTEGYEEHLVGEPLKLKSAFWEIQINTTTGEAEYIPVC